MAQTTDLNRHVQKLQLFFIFARYYRKKSRSPCPFAAFVPQTVAGETQGRRKLSGDFARAPRRRIVIQSSPAAAHRSRPS